MKETINILKVAKHLNIGLGTIVELLGQQGVLIECKPNAKINMDLFYFLIKKLNGKKYLKPDISGRENVTTLSILKDNRFKSHDLKSVYKFTSIEYGLLSLKDKYLYYSEYNLLNDPFDCNLRLIHFDRKIRETKLYQHNLKIGLDKLGICCFTKRNDSVLMWSHYANKHSGLCFEFKYDLNDKGIKPLEVVYKEKFIKADFNQYGKDAYYHMLYSKANCWSYEEEMRSIKFELENIEDRKIRFNDSDLIAVYMGVNCKKYEDIKAILKEYTNKVKLFKCEMRYNSFDLDFSRVNY